MHADNLEKIADGGSTPSPLDSWDMSPFKTSLKMYIYMIEILNYFVCFSKQSFKLWCYDFQTINWLVFTVQASLIYYFG